MWWVCEPHTIVDQSESTLKIGAVIERIYISVTRRFCISGQLTAGVEVTALLNGYLKLVNFILILFYFNQVILILLPYFI